MFSITFTRMKPDVLAYTAMHRCRLSGARGVHLYASQLSREVVSNIRDGGCEVNAWEVNDQQALELAWELEIPCICTDNLRQATKLREDRCAGGQTPAHLKEL